MRYVPFERGVVSGRNHIDTVFWSHPTAVEVIF